MYKYYMYLSIINIKIFIYTQKRIKIINKLKIGVFLVCQEGMKNRHKEGILSALSPVF